MAAAAADAKPRPVAPPDAAAPQPDAAAPQPDAAADKAGKKPAWSRPSAEAGSVIDAAAWPALSESARASPKSSSSESLKSLADGSEAAIPSPVPQAKPDPPIPARQRSMKRGGGDPANGLVANGGPARPAPAPGDRAHAGGVSRPPAVEIPVREGDGKNGSGWDHGGKAPGFSPQGHGRNEHRSGYGGGNRKGGNGGGMHYNGNNGRRDHDRWGHEWVMHPNYGGKHSPMSPHQRPMQRPFFQPPLHAQMPFVGPPSPARPFVAPIPFPDVATPMMYAPGPPLPPDAYRPAVPFAGPPMMFFPFPSPHMSPDQDLAKNLIKQIDYYFSNENLCKDVFLRQNMNEEGWVPVTLIADFNKVKQLTSNIQFILDAVRASSVVEVQGDQLRRRNEWPLWLMRPHGNPATSNQSSEVPVLDNLAGRIRSIGLGEGAGGHGSAVVPARPFNG